MAVSISHVDGGSGAQKPNKPGTPMKPAVPDRIDPVVTHHEKSEPVHDARPPVPSKPAAPKSPPAKPKSSAPAAPDLGAQLDAKGMAPGAPDGQRVVPKNSAWSLAQVNARYEEPKPTLTPQEKAVVAEAAKQVQTSAGASVHKNADPAAGAAELQAQIDANPELADEIIAAAQPTINVIAGSIYGKPTDRDRQRVDLCG